MGDLPGHDFRGNQWTAGQSAAMDRMHDRATADDAREAAGGDSRVGTPEFAEQVRALASKPDIDMRQALPPQRAQNVLNRLQDGLISREQFKTALQDVRTGRQPVYKHEARGVTVSKGDYKAQVAETRRRAAEARKEQSKRDIAAARAAGYRPPKPEPLGAIDRAVKGNAAAARKVRGMF